MSIGCSDVTQPGPQTQRPAASEIRARTDAVVPQIREPYQIEVTGSKDRWHVRYPGAEGRTAMEGNARTFRNIHVPLRTNVVLLLKSTDYVYTLALPQLKLKEIAVPDLEFPLELCPQEVGRFALVGNPLCGDPHSELEGFLIVETRDRFLDWLKSADSASAD